MIIFRIVYQGRAGKPQSSTSPNCRPSLTTRLHPVITKCVRHIVDAFVTPQKGPGFSQTIVSRSELLELTLSGASHEQVMSKS
ncbi:MAG: hypothetical protein ACI8P0_005725 [Planctomycetaceae bacterium]|jgi:hypothetical protein